MIDDKDIQILKLLQKNARISNAEIARSVGMAQSGTLERLRKLEERGVITGYDVRIDPAALDLRLLAYVFVTTRDVAGSASTAVAVAEHPEILEVHHLAGEDCFIAKIRAADPGDLARVLRERIGGEPEVTATRTTIVLETIKEGAPLPLPESSGGRDGARDAA